MKKFKSEGISIVLNFLDKHLLNYDEALTRAFVILNENDDFDYCSNPHTDTS